MKALIWLKSEWVFLLLLLMPFGFIFYHWEQIPDRVPVHFNLEGLPDRWSDSPFALLQLPLLSLPLYVLFYFLPHLDKNKRNEGFYLQYLPLIRLLVHLFLFFIPVLMLFGAINNRIDIWFLKIGLVLFIMLLSNFLSSTHRNYFIGFRTPWTLKNDVVWRQTHVFSARCWFWLSALVLVGIFNDLNQDVLLLVYAGLLVLIPFLYSYLAYRRLQSQN